MSLLTHHEWRAAYAPPGHRQMLIIPGPAYRRPSLRTPTERKDRHERRS